MRASWRLHEKSDLNIDDIAIEDVPHSHAAAARAVELALKGEVEALMKGSLHTDELMGAVVASPLRTERRMSHCFLMQTPAYPRPFIITDAALNIAPTLADKADIVRNAVDLAHAFGLARPRVAILAAVETINPHMPATLDAAALCKMADRGQIAGAILDGPLAFDNAVSAAAARTKGIVSDVAVLGRHPGRSRSRERQHAREAAHVPGRRGRAPASSSVRACRSCSRAARIRASRASPRARWRSSARRGASALPTSAAVPSVRRRRSGTRRATWSCSHERGQPILVLNCGSSSIKFALFDGDVEPLPRKPLWAGKVDGIGGSAQLDRRAARRRRARPRS